MNGELSPTARALVVLEAVQNNPGITAERLGERLGVTGRAARRYVAILREAGLPIESTTGPYGGYRLGRGVRLPPLTFSAAEAMGLVMAVLEGHREAADPLDLVGGALAKLLRVLPERVATPMRAFRDVSVPPRSPAIIVDPELTNRLIESCTAGRRLEIVYRLGDSRERPMQVDPWAVVLRHSRWYLLGWSHTSQARRVLRIDRIVSFAVLLETFSQPEDLDALRTLEEHLSQGWGHEVDVLVAAPPEATARWLPRSLARLEPDGEGGTRLRATTDELDWYARQLAGIPVPFRVLGSPPLQRAVAALAGRLDEAAASSSLSMSSVEGSTASAPTSLSARYQ